MTGSIYEELHWPHPLSGFCVLCCLVLKFSEAFASVFTFQFASAKTKNHGGLFISSHKTGEWDYTGFVPPFA